MLRDEENLPTLKTLYEQDSVRIENWNSQSLYAKSYERPRKSIGIVIASVLQPSPTSHI